MASTPASATDPRRLKNCNDYFFLYPAGHLGPMAVTLLVSLPLTHVIVVFLAGALVWVSLTEIVGELKVKP